MDNKYFTLDQTLFEITENNPQTITVFGANGFPQMLEEEKRKSFGKNITLKTALSFQNRDPAAFSKILISSIEKDMPGTDITLGGESKKAAGEKIKVTGLLPCPVRIPLLEAFGKFMEGFEKNHNLEIEYELKAAAMGLDWVEKNLAEVKDKSGIPDLFISAGFDLFFDEDRFAKLKKDGVFSDEVHFESENSSFSGYNLKDPRGHYSMIGVVPAVFLVNTNELGNRKVPLSWADVLKPEYENSISLPVGDFDLFNAILLNIHKNFGKEGVEKLGRSLLDSLHPSEMVKSEKKSVRRPSITIMPYFFTKTIKEGSIMKAVWPSDGAILSPIFMLSKKDRINKLKDVINFFASKKVGEILSHSGLFPSTNPEVDNRLKEGNTFMWLGWDYIYSIQVAATIKECEQIFDNSIREVIGA
ncbi:MAG: ABC transporter substrate-binding protein [Spirochaetia bacterium]|jgi:ABC-type Fe3+ transport system substrate-binding protein|nr:ABC transporter substrate-binding protein [Spirochaetia bacterium]